MINKTLLHEYIKNTKNPLACYNLALNYYAVKHYGEAVSFFLRAAEFSEGDLRYNSMLHVAFCYRELGGRHYTLNSIYKSLVSRYPDRPESYYHLAKLCEKENVAIDGYMWANLCLQNITNLNTKFDYLELDGPLEPLFLKAEFAWRLDKFAESRRTYQHILKNHLHELDDGQKDYLRGKLLALGMAPEWKTIQKYDKNNRHQWIYHFDGIETIDHNHSQALQDMFTLYCHNGKRNGTYLEVGSAYPYYTNNTALLEDFGWRGVGLDLNPDFIENYNSWRKNKSILTDALTADYDALLQEYCSGTTDIDYLQLDIKTSEETYKLLKRIPFDKYRFAVITYEHDDYVDTTQNYRKLSRDFLWSKGYLLAVADVSPIDGYSFEDWWIHPDLIDINRVWAMNRCADLEWGDINEWDRATTYRQVQLEKVYDYWKTVQDGDIVVDIGASNGAFSVSSLRKKIKELHVVESSPKLIELAIQNTLKSNHRDVSIKYHNQAIIKDSILNSSGTDEEVSRTTFKEFINKNNIPYIDFLKIDIEGAEYDIFLPENLEYLKNNVGFMAVEFHLRYENNKQQWKFFRNFILDNFPNRKIMSCTTQSIVPNQSISLEQYLMVDEFVDQYNSDFMIYINNDPTYV